MTDRNEDDVVLDVRNLTIEYESNGVTAVAVDDVSFTIRKGEIFGLAGESGSGKSTIANAILQLLGGNGRISSGSVLCNGVDISTLDDEALRTFRWQQVAMVFQSAMNALNPVMTVGDQIIDVYTTHRGMRRAEARTRARELLQLVGIDPERADAYPHQLSGGMRQRAVIAIALTLEPPLLIMDEPTTALDVVVQQEIIHEIKQLQHRLGFAVLFITHDLSLMVEITQRLGVMRHGRLLEVGPSAEVYAHPQHAYTRQLIDAFPPVRHARSTTTPLVQADRTPVVEVRGLRKEFTQGGLFRKQVNVAVRDVDLTLHQSEIMALVGESGSGKSTIARILARLEAPTAGRVVVDGVDVLEEQPRRASRAYRRSVQMVFQDPFASLNPAKPIRHFLERPLAIHYPGTSVAERRGRAAELMESVELDAGLLDRHPHELSGGQRQRIAIARALAVEPSVILADEPTSMLDVSVRMGILRLLQRLRDDRGISILYITHDLASARFIADTTMVMLRGALVEGGPSGLVMDDPRHPYTRLLLSAAPDPHRGGAFDKANRARERRAVQDVVDARGTGPTGRDDLGDGHWIDLDGLTASEREHA